MCKDGMSFYQIRQAVNCSDATIKRYIEVFSLNNMNNQPKPTDNNPKVDESAVNKYMLSLGYKWEHYDAGLDYQWVKDGYKVSQLQAISMYTAIERPVDLQPDEMRLIGELYSILGSFDNYARSEQESVDAMAEHLLHGIANNEVLQRLLVLHWQRNDGGNLVKSIQRGLNRSKEGKI